MRKQTAHLLRVFVTGLLAALPLIATVAVVWWAVNLVFGLLGPNSGIGRVLVALGFGVTGSVLIGYLFGVAVVMLGIFALGVVVTNGLQRGLSTLVGPVRPSAPPP